MFTQENIYRIYGNMLIREKIYEPPNKNKYFLGVRNV